MIVLLLLCAALLPIRAQAADVYAVQRESLGVEELEKTAQELAQTPALDAETELGDGLAALFQRGRGLFGTLLREALRGGLRLLVIVLICEVTEGVFGAVGGDRPSAAALAGTLAVTAFAVSDLRSVVVLGQDAIGRMETFSKALLPTMAAVVTLGGAPSGGAVRQMATALFSDLLISMVNQVLIPMVYAYLALSAAYAALGNEGLRKLAAALKWAASKLLTVLLFAFVTYLTVSGAVAGSADAAKLRAAKFTVSSMVPVVGGILSDASEAVLAGAGILKGAIGVFGMLSVLGICLVPFLTLGLRYLVYKVMAALGCVAAGGRLAGFIDDIGSAYALVLAMTGSCALLLLFSLIAAICTGVPS